MNHVGLGSLNIKLRKLPNISLSAGLIGVPVNPGMPLPYRIRNRGKMIPGFSVRFGGNSDKTNAILKSIAGRFKRL